MPRTVRKDKIHIDPDLRLQLIQPIFLLLPLDTRLRQDSLRLPIADRHREELHKVA